MIKYARRKPKKDFFILWLGLSTMCFGIGGVTLQGVSAVRSTPVLMAGDPVAIPVSIVSIPDGIGGGNEIDQAIAGPIDDGIPEDVAVAPQPEVVDLAGSPIAEADPLALPMPEPLSLDDATRVEDKALDAPHETTVEETDPVPTGDTPPEPEPESVKPMEEPKAAAEPKPEPKKIESKPPAPAKKVVQKPTPKKKATPPKPAPKPKPAPRAKPVGKNPNVVVQKPKILYRPNLRYPEEAKRKGISGSLLLDVRVGTNGRVTSVKVARSSGHRVLDNEAIAAVRAWRFEPAKNVFGKPMSNTIRVPVYF